MLTQNLLSNLSVIWINLIVVPYYQSYNVVGLVRINKNIVKLLINKYKNK